MSQRLLRCPLFLAMTTHQRFPYFYVGLVLRANPTNCQLLETSITELPVQEHARPWSVAESGIHLRRTPGFRPAACIRAAYRSPDGAQQNPGETSPGCRSSQPGITSAADRRRHGLQPHLVQQGGTHLLKPDISRVGGNLLVQTLQGVIPEPGFRKLANTCRANRIRRNR